MAPRRNHRWYGLSSQSDLTKSAQVKTGGTKQLVSLIVLLILVILMIQKTGDVKKVEEVGKAIGLFDSPRLHSVPVGETAIDAKTSTTGEIPLAEHLESAAEKIRNLSPVQSEIFESVSLRSTSLPVLQLASIWIELLKLEDADRVADALFLPTDKSKTVVADWALTATIQIDGWDELLVNIPERESDRKYLQFCRSLLGTMTTDSEPNGLNEDLELAQRALHLALQHKILQNMKDGEPWRGTEHSVSLKLWNRTRQLGKLLREGTYHTSSIPLTNPLVLTSSKANPLKGQIVKLRGTVELVDSRIGKIESSLPPSVENSIRPSLSNQPAEQETSKNAIPETADSNSVQYRVLWIKTEESPNNPIALFVPMNDKLDDSTEGRLEFKQGDYIEFVGISAKRFAYAAIKGPEVAPCVFAAEIAKEAHPKVSASSIDLFHTWLAQSRAIPFWNVPIDYRPPYALLLQAVQGDLSKLEESSFDDIDKGISEIGLVLLHQAIRLNQEIKTLCTGMTDWNLGPRIKVSREFGWANSITTIAISELPGELKSKLAAQTLLRMDRNQLYLIQYTSLHESDSGSAAKRSMLCATVPTPWLPAKGQRSAPLHMPFSADAILWSSSSEPGTPYNRGVAEILGWEIAPSIEPKSIRREELIPQISLSDYPLLLAGWNLTDRDLIRALQRPVRPLTHSESRPFFKLIDIESKTPIISNEMVAQTPSIADWIVSTLSGRPSLDKFPSVTPVQLTGRVVRVAKIPVSDLESSKWLNADHYYQLDCMADIGQRTFELANEDSSISYHNEYPVTCVLKELPDWLKSNTNSAPPSNIETSTQPEEVFYPRMRVQGRGWLYRLWSYQSIEMLQYSGNQQRQTSPLIVLSSIEKGGSSPSESLSSTGRSGSTNQRFVLLIFGAVAWWGIRKWTKPKKIRFRG